MGEADVLLELGQMIANIILILIDIITLKNCPTFRITNQYMNIVTIKPSE